MLARAAAIAATQAHSRPPRREWNTQEARIRVAGSSRTRSGSTTDSCPWPRAADWSRKPAVMASTPPNHVGWCARLQISRGLRFCFLGTSRFALRCSTDDGPKRQHCGDRRSPGLRQRRPATPAPSPPRCRSWPARPTWCISTSTSTCTTPPSPQQQLRRPRRAAGPRRAPDRVPDGRPPAGRLGGAGLLRSRTGPRRTMRDTALDLLGQLASTASPLPLERPDTHRDAQAALVSRCGHAARHRR